MGRGISRLLLWVESMVQWLWCKCVEVLDSPCSFLMGQILAVIIVCLIVQVVLARVQLKDGVAFLSLVVIWLVRLA